MNGNEQIHLQGGLAGRLVNHPFDGDVFSSVAQYFSNRTFIAEYSLGILACDDGILRCAQRFPQEEFCPNRLSYKAYL